MAVFSIEDFTAEINNPNFHTDIQYDSVHDYRSAVKVSKTVIADHFGPQSSGNDWFMWRSLTVRHNKENDIWHVSSGIIFPPLMFGGGYDVLIASDGKVIAVWGSK